jgi:iron complex transport system ATP-binding protein
MSPAALRVEGLSWGAKRGLTILHSTTFAVSPGRILGIVGANGAGKSTLLRLLSRYLKPATGRIFLDDQDIWSMTARDVAQGSVSKVVEIDFWPLRTV